MIEIGNCMIICIIIIKFLPAYSFISCCIIITLKIQLTFHMQYFGWPVFVNNVHAARVKYFHCTVIATSLGTSLTNSGEKSIYFSYDDCGSMYSNYTHDHMHMLCIRCIHKLCLHVALPLAIIMTLNTQPTFLMQTFG